MRFFGGLGGGSDLHRDFHSTPDLNVQVQSSILAPKGHRSQEDVNALNGRNGLPPPNHPPPPPPVGQVVKVNVGANVPDVVTPASVYDNMAHIQQVKGVYTYIYMHTHTLAHMHIYINVFRRVAGRIGRYLSGINFDGRLII